MNEFKGQNSMSVFAGKKGHIIIISAIWISAIIMFYNPHLVFGDNATTVTPFDIQNYQSQPDQSQPDQSQPDQSQPDQSQPDQSQPDQSQPDQSQPDQSQVSSDHNSHSQVSSDHSQSLKVIVKLSYSKYTKSHGTGAAYFNFYDDNQDFSNTKKFPYNEFPKKVTVKFPSGAVDVGEGFTICIQSYKYDDANCTTGINHIKKSAEHVKLDFP